MMIRRKLMAVLFAALALTPVLAAGRPACCVKKAPVAAQAAHGCCAAMAGTQASAPKGCCKAPMAPKSEAKVKDGAQLALSVPQSLGAPAMASVALTDLVSTHLARRAHHAAAPDDSPPDLLSRLHILLI